MKAHATLVRDIMTHKVVTLFEEDNLIGVEKGMEHFKFRHLPVVDNGKLVGLVTHRDILRVAASTLEHGAAQRTKTLFESVFVRDVMQKEVVTARADMTLLDAGRMMWTNKISCLPVVGDDRTLLGIITEGDFLKLALTHLEEQPAS